MSDTINGYTIIATWHTPARGSDRAGRIITVDRGMEHEERYVVAWMGDGRHFWEVTAYCCDIAEASRVFVKRIEREVSR